jgi:hypothetical protein
MPVHGGKQCLEQCASRLQLLVQQQLTVGCVAGCVAAWDNCSMTALAVSAHMQCCRSSRRGEIWNNQAIDHSCLLL